MKDAVTVAVFLFSFFLSWLIAFGITGNIAAAIYGEDPVPGKTENLLIIISGIIGFILGFVVVVVF